ncbi:MAG: exosortase-associated EpsI family protein [Verrucomicrobiota bacterium]|nr:exosortase-associated EpsI family protein [Verrucomicrobiota bacterium]
MRRSILIFMSVGLLLVLVITGVFTFLVPAAEQTIGESLGEILPEEINGWVSQAVPLSSTPDGEERVLDVLNFDDYFAREYVRGNTKVMVYVAYWLPGSEPYSSVAIHNPDSCWVIAGWKIKNRESARKMCLAGFQMKQHEWGIYEKKGVETHVIFWHLLGGEPHEHIEKMVWTNSGLDSFKRQFYFIYNLYQMGFDLGKEQIFVRLSSNKPFDLLEKDPYFKNIIDYLRVLGIEE